jgi:hypothetical protein
MRFPKIPRLLGRSLLWGALAAAGLTCGYGAEPTPTPQPATSVSITIAGLVTTTAELHTPLAISFGIAEDPISADEPFRRYRKVSGVNPTDITIERPLQITDASWRQWLNDFAEHGTRKTVQLDFQAKGKTVRTVLFRNSIPVSYGLAARTGRTGPRERLRIRSLQPDL